jgi:peptidoglycan/xylan/chitin deacetylase (PgdA/CDA1 family)
MIFKIKFFFATLISFFFKSKHNNMILMYHKIVSKNNDSIFDVYFNDFKNHVTFLLNYYNCQNLKNVLIKKNSFSITFDDGYDDIFFLILPFVEKNKLPITVFITYDNINKKGYLTTDQLIKVSKSKFVNIGCHGYSHLSLDDYNSPFFNQEITKSKMLIEKIIKKKIIFFSFPNGVFSNNSIQKVIESNYLMAFNSTSNTFDLSIPIDYFRIPRVCIYSCDNLRTIKLRLLGKFDWISKFT